MAYIHVEAQCWRLSGKLVTDNAQAVMQESDALNVPDSGWAIDFANVEAIDSATVALLLAWVRRAKASSRSLSLVNVPNNLKSLIKLYGVEAIISA